MTDTSDELRVFEGARPTREGDLSLESQGMAPIPEDARYGGIHRMFTVWFTPNMELSGVFAGTLAVVLGLGFGLGLVAIIAGTIIGSLPVAILCTWGPKTGTAQVPLARLPFGKTIVLPGTVQWLSSIAWDALVGLFGGQAAQLLFHVPFWVGVAIVLGLEGIVSVFGYEFVHRLQVWGSAILFVLFIVLTVKIFQHHIVLPHNTVHGPALWGAFVLMITISVSEGISWATYGSDYSRYMKPSSSRAGIFWLTMAGLSASYIWVETIGLAGASVLGNQTAAGVRSLMGGGALGVLALIAIVFGAIASNSMNDYTGSLAFQALGARLRRPVIAAVVAVLAFAAILWMNAGDTSGKFENLLLFIGYWIAPFCAIVMIDWHYHKDTYTPGFLRRALTFSALRGGWPALLSFVAAFGCMVPFMNTSIIVGPAATALDGADLAFYVGFIVAGILYYALLKVVPSPHAARAAEAGVGTAADDPAR
ncbi:MAG TPA: cytosine permease [Streptosporangiaceae bacterium]|nr:cytosine permease [Streptosporangiaceae bacterium]